MDAADECLALTRVSVAAKLYDMQVAVVATRNKSLMIVYPACKAKASLQCTVASSKPSCMYSNPTITIY